jgi:hypothetical protein
MIPFRNLCECRIKKEWQILQNHSRCPKKKDVKSFEALTIDLGKPPRNGSYTCLEWQNFTAFAAFSATSTHGWTLSKIDSQYHPDHKSRMKLNKPLKRPFGLNEIELDTWLFSLNFQSFCTRAYRIHKDARASPQFQPFWSVCRCVTNPLQTVALGLTGRFSVVSITTDLRLSSHQLLFTASGHRIQLF